MALDKKYTLHFDTEDGLQSSDVKAPTIRAAYAIAKDRATRNLWTVRGVTDHENGCQKFGICVCSN